MDIPDRGQIVKEVRNRKDKQSKTEEDGRYLFEDYDTTFVVVWLALDKCSSPPSWQRRL